MFVASTFRSQFPEFKDADAYPDAQISFWAGLAAVQVLPAYWGNALDQGVSLFVAHNLVLAGGNKSATGKGGAPGLSGGIVSSKSVGSVSVSYDTANSVEKDAGVYNSTTYGRMFIRLARMYGAGAIQL